MIVYGHYYQVLIDIRVDGAISVKDGHDIASIVQDTLRENPKITHVTVHVNPEES
jgi:divalent metal cation (Fe/Co/Zn/Cd) transporter